MMNPLASSEVLNIAIVKGAASQNGKSFTPGFITGRIRRPNYLHSPNGKDKQLD